MVRSDLNGHIYRETIDRQMPKLMLMGIDMKPMLESEMAQYQIESNAWPDYHSNRHMMTVPAEFESIEEIEKNYNKVIEVKLEQNTQ